uniref:Lipocalin/cytosolic fatty-acid binding domain-containing protein n=2 Tax=Oncorhynchus tshawytscha TaxID=74940 RepID=A0A8C8EQZ2_ONCTS
METRKWHILAGTLMAPAGEGTTWPRRHFWGKLIFKSECWSNENDMRVVDVKYDEYALIHTKTKGVSAVLTNLYVYLVCHVLYRGTDLSPGLLQKFRQFSLDTGYPPQKMIQLICTTHL